MKVSIKSFNATISLFKDTKNLIRNATFTGAIFHGLSDYELNRGNATGFEKAWSILETIALTPVVYTTKLFDYCYNFVVNSMGKNNSTIQKVKDISYNALNFFRSYTFSRTIDLVSAFLNASLQNQPAAYTLFGYGISSPMIMAGAWCALEVVTLGCEVAARFYNKNYNDKIRALKSIDKNHGEIVEKLKDKGNLLVIKEFNSELNQDDSIIANKEKNQQEAQSKFKPSRFQFLKSFAEITLVYSLNLMGTYGLIYSAGGDLYSPTKTIGFIFYAFTFLTAQGTLGNKKTEYVITNSYGIKDDLASIKQKSFDLEVLNKVLSTKENSLTPENFHNLYNKEAKELFKSQPSNSFLASLGKHTYDELIAGTNMVNPIDKIDYRDGSIDIDKFQKKETTRRQSPRNKIHRD